MTLEIMLAAITLIVAVIGTLLKDPPRRVKAFLIVLAALASIGSVVKAIADESDKEFMKTALISTLVPSNSSYERLWADVDESAKARGFDQDARCIHSIEGMTCFLRSANDAKHGTLVFNKAEIAQMYANEISRKSNGRLIGDLFQQSYVPADIHEEFLEKIGVLEFAVFFDLFGRFPSDYEYDDPIGVRIDFERDGKKQSVGFSPNELSGFQQSQGPNVFYAFEQAFRKKFEDSGKH